MNFGTAILGEVQHVIIILLQWYIHLEATLTDPIQRCLVTASISV